MKHSVEGELSPAVLLAIFATALFLRLLVAYAAWSSHTPDDLLTLTPDSRNYVGAAQALSRGDIFEHRNDLFYFPPGYPLFLALHFNLFGENPIPILLLQTVLSAFTCVMLALIAIEVGLSPPVARLAGFLFAFLITSIALAAIPLSDTLYTFFFALSIWLAMRALKSGGLSAWIMIGLVCGLCILVRPIGKFWPLALMSVSARMLFIRHRIFEIRWTSLFQTLRGPVIAMFIAALCVLPWVARNARVHGLPVLAITTISAPATVAAKAAADISGKEFRAVQDEWDRKFLDQHAGEERAIDGLCRNAKYHTDSIVAHYPMAFAKVYANWTWENLHAPDYLLATAAPRFSGFANRVTEFFKSNGLLRLRFYLAVVGFLLLLIYRQFAAAMILGVTYLYCATTIGAFPYQGSRYALPAQVPGMILIAVVGVTGLQLLRWGFHRVMRRPTTI